jgi:hypothetical protein
VSAYISKDPSRSLGFASEGRPHQTLFHRWAEGNPGASAIRFGVVTALNSNPEDTSKVVDTIDVSCTDGTKEKNCEVLTDPSDWKNNSGAQRRPFIGSRCVIVTGPGGEAWAVGFTRPIKSGFTTDDGKDERDVSREGSLPGDKVWISPTGGKIILSAGSVISFIANPACVIQLNPSSGEAIVNGLVLRGSADGYKMRRGRLPGTGLSASSATLSRELFQDAVTASTATSWVEDTGAAGTAAVPAIRQVTIKQSGTVPLGREYYTKSAGFVGQMQSYRYGSSVAGENFVLGQVLKSILKDFLNDYLKHSHGSAVGPTSPPTNPAKALELLSTKIEPELFLSSFMFTQKLPGL